MHLSVQLQRYPEVGNILKSLKKGLLDLFKNNIVGIYVTGSLTHGDFDAKNSDIDIFVVLHEKLTNKELVALNKLHTDIGRNNKAWNKRIEVSYITKDMLNHRKPPKETRPYVNAGKIWHFPFGNEWLINLYSLHGEGVALYGTNPKKLFPDIDKHLDKIF